MRPNTVIHYYNCYYPIQLNIRERGNNILLVTVVKAKVDKLEDVVREGFPGG